MTTSNERSTARVRDRHPALSVPPDELAELQAEFPCYRIWREDICGRIRYIARSLRFGLNPHTVVTACQAELRTALSPPRPEASSLTSITATAASALTGSPPVSNRTAQQSATPGQRGSTTTTAAPATPTTTQQLRHPLSALRAEFPGYQISLENLCGKIRYVARTRYFGLNPHTVVTNDLDELAAALAPARHYGLLAARQDRP